MFWLITEYGVSTSIGYDVSNLLSNTTYSIQKINTAYPLPLDTTYQSSVVHDKEFNKQTIHTLHRPENEKYFDHQGATTLSRWSHERIRSPDFNLLSDQEYSKEEITETMAETMEQYMSKTRTDYGSGVARPKIDNKDQFEMKGQFLKELRENTFSGSDNEDATTSRWLRNEPTGLIKTWEDLKTKFLNKYCPPGRTATKMEEINNFQQELDETLYQAWERFKEILMKCCQHYLTEMQEVILFCNGLDVPTRQILDSRGAIPTMTAADAKKAIQEMAEYS
ncbi:hypothetical protein Tco_0091621 [Tanacetum coccineum]